MAFSGMQDHQVQVYWLDLREIEARTERYFLRLLTQEEHNRRLRFHFAEDRLRFAAGRALARVMLSAQSDYGPEQITFGAGENGRPHIAEGPTKTWFNLSHSGDIVALAVASFRRIGIDTEKARQGVADELEACVSAPCEQAAFQVLNAQQRDRIFFEMWTLKEAYMKATSQGLGLDPRRCAFDLNDLPRALRLQAADHEGEEPLEDWRFALWRLPNDQSLAVCAGPPDRKSIQISEPVDANQIVARIQV